MNDRARRCPAQLIAFLVILLGSPASAREQAVPCGSCLALSLTPAQAETAADATPGGALSGLTVMVTGADDLAAAVGAVARLRQLGAQAGLVFAGVSAPPAALLAPGAVDGPVLIDVSGGGAVDEQVAFQLKTTATALRAAKVSTLGIGLRADQEAATGRWGLAPYFDFVVRPASSLHPVALASLQRWTSLSADALADLPTLLAAASRSGASKVLLPLPPGREPLVALLASLARAVPAGLTPLPEVRADCDGGCEAEAYLDAAALDAVVVVRPRSASWWLRVRPAATRIDAITLEGRDSRPSPALHADGPELLLPAVTAPLVLRVEGWQGGGQQAFATGVEVSGARTLSVDEIIARHQAAEAAAKAAVRNLISSGETVLTFEAPGFAAPLAITARTTVYTSGGETEVAQDDIRVNGLALATRGDQVPRLPLIEPERVTTPPLAIALTEAYVYRLDGEEAIGARRCFVVAFRPRLADRTLYSGRAWIDAQTFGVVRLDASQAGLPGPVVSSREVHDFIPDTERGVPVWLPSRSEIQQVYETATFSTPIHRLVRFERRAVNVPDYQARLEAAYRSDAVMMKDTPRGYRYLRRDRPSGRPAAGPAGRHVVADRVQRVRTVAGGVTLDPNISVPLVFAGISYVNFNVAGTGAQLDAFFGGTYGRIAWSSPPLRRSGWRLSGDAFGLAVSYNDRAFRGGVEQYRENVAQRPFHASLALGGPLAGRLRLRAAYELDYTAYARSDSTATSFAVPASTPVHGVRLTLERQRGPWTLAASWNRAWRQRWTRWGLPSAAEPIVRDFDRYAVRGARSFAWSPRLVARLEAQWMGGRRLDRFSRYAFGTFENPLRGYPSAGIRYDRGAVLRSALSWSAAPRLRLDIFADGALVRDPGFSRRARTFPGAGAAIEAPLPFGLLTSFEWGYGFEGVNSDGSRGTQVVKISVYKAF